MPLFKLKQCSRKATKRIKQDLRHVPSTVSDVMQKPDLGLQFLFVAHARRVTYKYQSLVLYKWPADIK